MSGFTKRAWVREEGFPAGSPAPLHLICGCGGKVMRPEVGNAVCGVCGTTYDKAGWVLVRPALEVREARKAEFDVALHRFISAGRQLSTAWKRLSAANGRIDGLGTTPGLDDFLNAIEATARREGFVK